MSKAAVVQSEYKIGVCKWCSDEGQVFRDTGYCDTCDSNIVRCSICKTDEHYEDHCRHVFQDEGFEWRGAGVRADDPELKQPFFKLLSLMPTGFAADLRKAIRSGRFYTWIVAPLIGGAGFLELHGMPDRDGRFMLFEWGKAMIALGEGDHAEETADAYHWLASLYERKTLKANRATIAWIDEWSATTDASTKEDGK